MGGLSVGGEQSGDVEIEDQLAVGNDEGFIFVIGIEQLEGVPDTTAGAE